MLTVLLDEGQYHYLNIVVLYVIDLLTRYSNREINNQIELHILGVWQNCPQINSAACLYRCVARVVVAMCM